MQDEKFRGHCVKIDGKKFTEKQIKKMEKLNTRNANNNKEEEFNPKKNKINKSRIHFHYVGNIFNHETKHYYQGNSNLKITIFYNFK